MGRVFVNEVAQRVYDRCMVERPQAVRASSGAGVSAAFHKGYQQPDRDLYPPNTVWFAAWAAGADCRALDDADIHAPDSLAVRLGAVLRDLLDWQERTGAAGEEWQRLRTQAEALLKLVNEGKNRG